MYVQPLAVAHIPKNLDWHGSKQYEWGSLLIYKIRVVYLKYNYHFRANNFEK